MVTILGLYMLSGDSHSLIEGFKVVIERNQAKAGIWAEVVARNAQKIVHADRYNRLAIMQPITHEVVPWPSVIFGLLYVGIWYNVINQFMIQRVLGAKNIYHARMGIVFASYLKIILPLIVVLPGLIFFAKYPEIMKLPWEEIRPEADKGYVTMLQMLVPVGLRGLFLAALFGAIQSTVNSVLNSTATIFTLDIYKRIFYKDASEKHLVRIGMWSSVAILIIAIILAGFINRLGGSLFVYIQSLYAFFAPPFSVIFLLGILFRWINGTGATISVIMGFLLGIAIKVYVQLPGHPVWLEPFAMQAIINFGFCTVVCIIISLLTSKPIAEQVTDKLTLNWKNLNILNELGTKWYKSVTLWWFISFLIVFLLIFVVFSGFYL